MPGLNRGAPLSALVGSLRRLAATGGVFALAFASHTAGPADLFAQQSRPMQIDDLFTIESYKGQAISPDGEWIAAVIQRARTDREVHNRPFLGGGDKSDIWLISRRDGQRRNLTNGLADASGYWRPVWSPDGARLAMISTKGHVRGGDNLRLWVDTHPMYPTLTGREIPKTDELRQAVGSNRTFEVMLPASSPGPVAVLRATSG